MHWLHSQERKAENEVSQYEILDIETQTKGTAPRKKSEKVKAVTLKRPHGNEQVKEGL